MSNYLDFTGYGIAKFTASGTPGNSIVGARVDDIYSNKDTGMLFVCTNDTFGSQVWLGTDGVSYPPPSIASFSHPDLIAAYTMDNISGSTLIDETGSGKDATLVGNPSSVAGVINNALSFDGVDDYIDSPAQLIPSTGSFSINFWVSLADIVGTKSLVAQWRDSITSTRFRLATSNAALAIRYGSNTTTTGEVFSASVSQMITFSSDGSTGQVYVDGSPVGSPITTTATLEAVGTLIGGNSTSGSVYNANVGTFHKGLIDQFRVFNRALTSSEITALYNGGAGI